MAWRVVRAIALCASLLRIGAVGAQDDPAAPGRIDVSLQERCEGVERDELRRLIALELAPRSVKASAEDGVDSASIRASVTCTEQRADLSVVSAVTRQPQALTLDLSQIAVDAQARLLALSLSELVASLDLDAPTTPIQPRPRAAPATARTTHARGAPSQRAWFGAGLARQGAPAMLMPGVQVGISLAPTHRPLLLEGALALQRGERAVRAGDVEAWTLSGSLGIAGRLERAWAELTLGAGLSFGYASLHGEKDAAANVDGRTVTGLWWGPLVAASAVLPARARWGVRGGVDLGYVARELRGLDASGNASFALRGLQLQASVGVSLKLGAQQHDSSVRK